jgi:hypothetical protein
MFHDFKTEIILLFVVMTMAITLSVGGIFVVRYTQPVTPLPQLPQAKSISITAPVGGEQWVVGSTQIITWESAGINKVRISPAVGGKGLATSEEIDASAGRYDFTVPDMSGFGKEPPYEVSILIFDAKAPSVSDRATFTATNSSVTTGKVQCNTEDECKNFECPVSGDPLCIVYADCTADDIKLILGSKGEVTGECVCATICQ